MLQSKNVWALLWIVSFFTFSTMAGSLIVWSLVISLYAIFLDLVQTSALYFGVTTPDPRTSVFRLVRWINTRPLVAHAVTTFILAEIFVFIARRQGPHS